MSTPIWSPCKKVCVVDPSQSLCVGCFRTLDELGRWTLMTHDERLAARCDRRLRLEAGELASDSGASPDSVAQETVAG